MRTALFAVAVVALMVNRLPAQKPTTKPGAKPTVPKKITDQLKPILDKLKETPAEVVEKKPGEFVKTKEVASKVRIFPAVSDFADKPYTVRINRTSNHQETKIYGDKEKAEKSRDWLPVGKIAGAGNAGVVPQNYNAVFFYVNGKWVLEEITWSSNLSGISVPRGFQESLKSTKNGNKTKWSAVLGEGENKEKKDTK